MKDNMIIVKDWGMDDLPKVGLASIKTILARTVAGSERDLRTPFYNTASRSSIMNLLEGEIGEAAFSGLRLVDELEKRKVGPQSVMFPWSQRRSNLLEYFGRDTPGSDRAWIDEVWNFRADIGNVRSLTPLSIEEAIDKLPSNTNLGLPYAVRNRKYLQWYKQEAATFRSDMHSILFWRGQASGPRASDVKQRDVWGMPKNEAIRSKRYSDVVLRYLKMMSPFSAYVNPDAVDTSVSLLVDSSISGGYPMYSFDYSGFDRTVAPWMIEEVLAMVFSLFNDDEADVNRHLAYLSLCENGIVTPDGVISGTHGLASGSGFTSVVGSLINFISIRTIAKKLKINLMGCVVSGDDGVAVFSETKHLEDEIASVVRQWGMYLDYDYEPLPGTCHYLQKWYSDEHRVGGICRGVRSPFRILTGLTGHERYHRDWNSNLETMRWVMQTENCKWDPRFNSLVEWVARGDRLLSSGVDPHLIMRGAGPSKSHIQDSLGYTSYPAGRHNPTRLEEFAFWRVYKGLRL